MKDLRSYLDMLEPGRELMTVEKVVTPGEELSTVVKRLEPYGAPGVLFNSVKGSEWPVLMGTFGVRDRIARALGVPVERCLDYVRKVQDRPLPEPIDTDDAPVRQVEIRENDVDLEDLPFATHSRSDAGRYITAGVVLARDPHTGNLNTGMYRMMITGRNTLTVNAAPDHDLGRIFAAAREAGEKVPVAIVIGHHPAYLIASQIKNPVSLDAHRLAGGLIGEQLRVTEGPTTGLPLPADAEFILEGIVDPGNPVQEGPFGEFSYHYGAANAPVCTVTAINHRKEPIFQDLHPTHSEHLCLWLFPGREARLYEAVRRSVPGVLDVRIPFHGGSFSAFISLRKRKTGDGKQAILSAFAADHFLKCVTVVDEDIDVHRTEDVLWASHVRFQAERDMLVLSGMKGIRMDPSAEQFTTSIGTDTLTDKIGVDATRPLTGFPERADLPHHGFEDINVSEYINQEAQTTVARLSSAGAWLKE